MTTSTTTTTTTATTTTTGGAGGAGAGVVGGSSGTAAATNMTSTQTNTLLQVGPPTTLAQSLSTNGLGGKSSTLTVMRFTKLTPIVSCENLADMDQPPLQQQQHTTVNNNNADSSSDRSSPALKTSHIKRKSAGLIESVTRVNVSDGIFSSSKKTIANGHNSQTSTTTTTTTCKDQPSARQFRSASAVPTTTITKHRTTSPPVTSLDNLGGPVLGSSSGSTDNDNEQSDYNSDEDALASLRLRFLSGGINGVAGGGGGGGGSSNAMRHLAARNAALASSNSSLNGSISSATYTAGKLSVLI